MNKNDILSLAGMPPGNRSYPFGPHHFVNRHYFNIIYEPIWPQSARHDARSTRARRSDSVVKE